MKQNYWNFWNGNDEEEYFLKYLRSRRFLRKYEPINRVEFNEIVEKVLAYGEAEDRLGYVAFKKLLYEDKSYMTVSVEMGQPTSRIKQLVESFCGLVSLLVPNTVLSSLEPGISRALQRTERKWKPIQPKPRHVEQLAYLTDPSAHKYLPKFWKTIRSAGIAWFLRYEHRWTEFGFDRDDVIQEYAIGFAAGISRYNPVTHGHVRMASFGKFCAKRRIITRLEEARIGRHYDNGTSLSVKLDPEGIELAKLLPQSRPMPYSQSRQCSDLSLLNELPLTTLEMQCLREYVKSPTGLFYQGIGGTGPKAREKKRKDNALERVRKKLKKKMASLEQ